VGIVAETCQGPNCTAVFLPGGISGPRERTSILNESLFDDDGALDGSPAILIENAPGYQLEFSSMSPNFKFNEADCETYGTDRGDGVYLCIGSNSSTIQAGSSQKIAANSGWSVCPTSLHQTGSCYNNTNWTSTLQQTTSLDIFKRYATVAYDRQNSSILDLETISAPETVSINSNDLLAIIGKSLTPVVNATADDISMTQGLVFQLGFVLRLQQDRYPDDNHTSVNILRGALTIPLQWSFSALVTLNVSATEADPNSTRYALPDDNKVFAYTADQTYRAMAKYPLTVYVFLGTAAVLILCSNLLFWYLYLQATVVPNTSFYPEIDVVSKAAHPSAGGRVIGDYNSVLRDAGLGNAHSMDIVREIKDKVVRVVETDGVNGEKVLVLVVAVAGPGEDGIRGEGVNVLRTGVNY
jgi:hypothetical protein